MSKCLNADIHSKKKICILIKLKIYKLKFIKKR